MRVSWLALVDSVLHPTRPDLERCLQERERHLAVRRPVSEERLRAIAGCERRIESARAAIFAASDGVVASHMTRLEREWLRLSRPDPDAGMMDLWARVAPPSWADQKRWRGSDASSQLDAAIALAADASGVEAAETAIGSLRIALAAWGIQLGARILWRSSESDADCTTALLAEPLRMASEAVAASDAQRIVLERAQQLERDVREALLQRFPERPVLASGVAHAAFVDFVFRAAALDDRPNPVTALRDLWKTGYVLSHADTSGVTVQIP
ncbi:MAG: hypothetical protein ABIP39_01985 [Polyangiaceae bacterium]